ncbi:hypothetical protein MASR2M15_28800 [Anaerolineales bacterium]
MRKLTFIILLVLLIPSMVPIFAQSNDELIVTDFFPAEQTNTDTQITVVFNRPMVPLTTIDNASALNPLQFTEDIQGEGKWINTSIYQFTPAKPLEGGKTYRVTIPAGLQALDGISLKTDQVFTFETLLPTIIGTIPQQLETDVPLNRDIQVNFSQPVDPAAFEAAFYLRLNVDADVSDVSGSFEWNADKSGFMFTPDEALAKNVSYLMGFSDAVTLDSVYEISFSTVPTPAIISVDPGDGALVSPFDDATYDGINGISINFASQMDQETLLDKITIQPDPGEVSAYYRDWSKSYSVSFAVQPDTTYKIDIAPGMTDIYGEAIQTPFSFSFQTTDFAPTIFIDSPGRIGFFDATRENTQIYIHYRNIEEMSYNVGVIDSDYFARQMALNPYEFNFNIEQANVVLPVDAPKNAYQFQLLDLSGSTNNYGCPAAMPSRVQVGDSVLVVTEPDSLRVRSSAPDGEIIEQAYKGYVMRIIGGPECHDNIIWWQVEIRNGQKGWVAEGLDDEYFIETNLSASPTLDLPASEGGALAPGIYQLHVDSNPPSNLGPYLNDNLYHTMLVSNVILTLKQMGDQIFVWAIHVDTGLPLANTPVKVYVNRRENNTIEQFDALTDAQGFAWVDLPQDLINQNISALIDSDSLLGFTSTTFSQGIQAWDFGISYDRNDSSPWETYMVSDRSLYRPGQIVYFRGVLRKNDDLNYTYDPAELSEVNLTITSQNGDLVYDQMLTLNDRFGSFSGEFQIADDAPLGRYYFTIVTPNQYDDVPLEFAVGEFRLPEFTVAVSTDAEIALDNKNLTALVDADYYFGGAVSGADVEYSVYAEESYFDYKGEGNYNFSDYSEQEYYGQRFITSDVGKMDQQGQYLIDFPVSFADTNIPVLNYIVEATILDESDQPVSGRTTIKAYRGEALPGINIANRVLKSGDTTTVNIITVNIDSEPLPNQAVQVDVFKREWFSVQEQDEQGRTNWTWDYEDTTVENFEVTTDENGRANFDTSPPEAGSYYIRITTSDAEGRSISSSDYLYVTGSAYISWQQNNDQHIDLIPDKDDYKVGEIAKVLIASPFQGEATALITVERGDVLKTELITMTSNSYVYEFPIEAEYSPNIFVTAMIIKPVDENNPVADFRMGMVRLDVDKEQRILTIDLEADTDQAKPGDTVTYTVHTSDYQGNPVSAEVGVSLTDLAALSVAEANTIDIVQFFFGKQSSGVQTSTALTINTDIITQYVKEVVKGGGKGGGFFGAPVIRNELIETPYWNSHLTTDENGLATFEVTLPDNLTTWQLDARGYTDNQSQFIVGDNTLEIKSTLPLIVRPATPRFFVVGDQSDIGAVVNNNTDEELSVTVSLNATGVEVNSPLEQTVTVPANGRARVDWSIDVLAVDVVQMTFTAQGGQYSDATISPVSIDEKGSLPVYRYIVQEVIGTAGVLSETGSRTEVIDLPENVIPDVGELSIKVEKSLAGAAIEGLDYLAHYQYFCTEQTVSRFLPNIFTVRAFNELGLENAELEAELDVHTNAGLQKLIAEQRPDGGWGWYSYYESDTLTTAYVLFGLYEAKQQGFPVSDSVMQSASRFLQSRLSAVRLSVDTWKLNRQAFVLYVLAHVGNPNVAEMSNLFEAKDRLALYSQAYLIRALYETDPTDSRIDTLANNLIDAAIFSATGVHWEESIRDWWNWNTDTRSSAIILGTLIEIKPDSDILPLAVRHLMIQRKADRWETTQETAWAVMTLTDWMKTSGELNPDYRFDVTLNANSVLSGDANSDNILEDEKLSIAIADMLLDTSNEIVFNRDGDLGQMYYTMHLKPYLPVPNLDPIDHGIILYRVFMKEGKIVDTAQVGDVLDVVITLIAPNELYYLVVDDPLPAGMESIDPSLLTSQQLDTEPTIVNKDDELFYGSWYFKSPEFRDEKVVLNVDYLPRGTYEYTYKVRVVTAGNYNVIPPTASEFYFPEVYGRGEGMLFTISSEQ